MPTTARFDFLRLKEIRSVFEKEKLIRLWRDEVRTILRHQDLLDLHDYYDFNLSIGAHAMEISAEVEAGKYHPEKPLVYRLEKSHGVRRHMCLPTPTDALVFQALTNALEEELLKCAPTDRSFYSRAHTKLKLPHEGNDPFDYPWFIQWRRFQKKIWNFAEDHEFLVVTDIANYFDSIGLNELRNIIASQCKTEEVILDLLFRVIEGMSWSPDYLPKNLRGLPTIHLDAPRLLAHCHLYEVDKVISNTSGENFVRWMDDLNIGVPSKFDGKKIISKISDVLKSRGLSLNLSKTSILSADEVREQFMVEENKFLDSIQKIKNPTAAEKKRCRKEFKLAIKKRNCKAWPKVTKRYINIAKRFDLTPLESISKELFLEHPELRPAILSFLSEKKPTKDVLDLWWDLVQEKYLDDVTQFGLAKIFTQWQLPVSEDIQLRLKGYFDLTNSPEGFGNFLAGLWGRSKYAEPEKLLEYIESTAKIWRYDRFLSRQAVAATGRLIGWNEKDIKSRLQRYAFAGSRDSGSVASNLLKLSSFDKIPGDVLFYLFPTNGHEKFYPLSKFIILKAVLSCRSSQDASAFQKGLKKYISDPWYKRWINLHSAGHQVE